MKRLLVALIGLLVTLPALAQAATCVTGTAGAAPSATLTFTAPTLNTDGTAVATPLTYTLFEGTTSGGEKQVATGLTGSPVTVTTGLVAGTTYYFTITVTDANGSVSAQSNEVCKALPKSVPGSVTITIS